MKSKIEDNSRVLIPRLIRFSYRGFSAFLRGFLCLTHVLLDEKMTYPYDVWFRVSFLRFCGFNVGVGGFVVLGF